MFVQVRRSDAGWTPEISGAVIGMGSDAHPAFPTWPEAEEYATQLLLRLGLLTNNGKWTPEGEARPVKPEHSDRYLVCLWRPNGRVIQRKTFKTRAGAHNAAARLSNDSLILHTTMHAPEDEHGKRVDLATFRNGEIARPVITTRNASDPRILRMVDYHTNHANEETTTMSKDDTGTTIEKPKPARAAKNTYPDTPKRKNPVTIEELLALPDSAIANLPPERRPDLPADAKLPVSTYALVYARFLTGQRKWYPNPWMSQTTAEDGRTARQAVRKAIGKAAGAKVGNADGSAPKKPKAAKPAPAAKPEAAPKPRRTRAAGSGVSKPVAKKPAAKKAAAKPKPAPKKK